MKGFRTVPVGQEPTFKSSSGKYQAISAQIRSLPVDQWLVVEGFDNADEFDRTAAGMSGGIRRELAHAGLRLMTRKYEADGRMELWIRKVSIEKP